MKKFLLMLSLLFLLPATWNATAHPLLGLPIGPVGATSATGQIVFHANGGSGSMASISGLSEGESLQLPRNTFTRQGYRFVGWTNMPGGNDPIFQDELANFTYYSGNSALYAVWEPQASALQITFDANGGQGAMEPLFVKANQTIIIPPHRFSPADEGYECKGYGLSPDDYVRYRIGGTATFTTSCTLYAFWSPMDGSVGGASEKYKGKTVFLEGVHIAPEDWVTVNEKPISEYAEWKTGCGWYDTDQAWLNFCWAATCSNVLHWWLDRNEEFIREYRKTHDIPEFGYYGKGKSDVFGFFTSHWTQNIGGHTQYGFNWFVNGIDNAVQESAKGKGGLFKDVFGGHILVQTTKASNRRIFNQFVVDALDNGRILSAGEINMSGGHAFTCWGADFDDEGYVCALYYSDSATPWNNTQTNRDLSLTKAVIKYHENANKTPYIETSVLINGEIQHGEIPITGLESYDQGTTYWEDYFAAQGQVSYTLTCTDTGGKTFDTQTVNVDAGAVITLPAYPFRTIIKASADNQELTINADGTVSTEAVAGKEITLQYADRLPFSTTVVENGNFTNAHWYLLGSDASGSLKLMRYGTGEQEPVKTGTLTDGQLTDENNLWCISGNVTDGFRLYNQAGGTDRAVAYTRENGKAIMNAAENEATVWSVATARSADSEQVFCFESRSAGNEKNQLCIADSEVTFGSAGTPATALYALSPTEGLMLSATAFENKLRNIPEGSVGGPTDRDAVAKAIETLKNAPTAANYDAVCSTFERKTPLREEQTYYLIEAETRQAVAVQKDGSFRTEDTGTAGANGMFLWEPAQNGNDYHILVQGACLGAAKSNSTHNEFGLEGQPLNGSSIKKGTFALIDGADARFYLQNTNTEASGTTYVHLNGQTMTACSDRVEGTLWYLVEAPELNFTISPACYATACYPFAVELPQGSSLKAYVGKVSTDGENNRLLLETLPDNRIPALTPVIISGEAGTYRLVISDRMESDERPDQDLAGTLLPETITANDYILGYKNENIGFYKVDAADLNLGSNKAYLPGSKLPAAAAGSGKLMISFKEDGTTGIDASQTKVEETEAYYDLQGRRVMHPGRGIYMTASGKKVLLLR